MPTVEFRPLLEAEIQKAGLSLSQESLDKLEGHYRLLVKWNRAVRLAGSVEPELVVQRHVLESLALIPYLQERRGSLLDIGSGNGYPAIPLKCVLQELRVCMMEPTLRKSVFLQTVVRELGFSDCDVTRARVDRPHDLARLGRWDYVTMRGVAAIPAVMAGGAASLRPDGKILFMVGESGRSEVLRRLSAPLDLVASKHLPESRASYIVVVGIAPEQTHESIH